MSLINEVLRKLDREPASSRMRNLPPHLQPARRHRPGQGHLAGWILAAFLAGGVSGVGVWWWTSMQARRAPAPAAEGPGATEPAVQQRKGETRKPATPREDEGDTGPGPAAGQVAHREKPVSPKPIPEPPMAAAPESGATAPPPEASERDRSGAAEGAEALRRPMLKESPDIPPKIAVNPNAEPLPRETAATGAPGAEQDPSRASVQVEVPDEVRKRRRASALARSGYQALEAGRYAEARSRLREALRLDPGSPDVMNNLALARWRSGRKSEAVDGLLDGVAEHPGNVRLARNLAHFLIRKGTDEQRASGAPILTEALGEQDRAELYALVGRLYRELGRFEEAATIYRHGLTRKGSRWRLLLGLGQALESRGKREEAREVYGKALDRLPAGQDQLHERLSARIQSLRPGGD
ncbi:tetratricopeptide repeat protein [Thiohalorhabdus methylotrophus]|uniref:Tetratricopeptide repeat protein n=1 Tax=Thiohalorhabdus methylotrophus TaxID=3242694 RepID=A0ABV4U0F3_9GAMM